MGVHALRRLEGMSVPPHVELFDGGTAALELLDVIANRKKVIVIDAVRGGGEPGALYRFHPQDAPPDAYAAISLHQVDFLQTLATADLLGNTPKEVIIFGVEPKMIDWGLELSVEVAAAVPRVIELVLEEIGTKNA